MTPEVKRPALDLLRRGAVMIARLSADGSAFVCGSGAVVAVSPGRARVVTCAHVYEALQEEAERRPVTQRGDAVCLFYDDMDFDKGTRLLPALIFGGWTHSYHDPGKGGPCDVALLDVRGANLPAFAFEIARDEPQKGQELAMFGYPAAGEDKACAPLRVTLGWYQGRDKTGELRAHLSSLVGDSGAPVVNLDTGELVGICSHGFETSLGLGGWIAGTALVPAAVVRKMLEKAEEKGGAP